MLEEDLEESIPLHSKNWLKDYLNGNHTPGNLIEAGWKSYKGPTPRRADLPFARASQFVVNYQHAFAEYWYRNDGMVPMDILDMKI